MPLPPVLNLSEPGTEVVAYKIWVEHEAAKPTPLLLVRRNTH